ncbi:deoxyribose-phosphate aldolase [Myroides pelagicus]|uniref:Deoxyribose-phosphate aldolase n=1 Tax=Myroides pelagicus TaxID=270914 RepID=A0A7K1GIB4_9FLAO|nr:deoxyribose-phosphate aldolase [Myroides pelagicus]MEC4112847.1 deoxyribose-phosphate aldolase [Myroides pelagicus]MTH28657.1 deoxyribose-phosphate aldolase [Myroides pelagicus]
MRDLREFMDSTYLKTAEQAGLSEAENNQVVNDLVEEAIQEHFKLAMIRPEQVATGRKLVDAANSKVLIGTVIDFPVGNGGLEAKLKEAKQAIVDGVDELDYVVDYNAFKKGLTEQVKDEVEQCTALGLKAGKVVKWIIEVAALKDNEIVQLTALIKNVVMSKFSEKDYSKVFVKSSTGFYKTPEGVPNGATIPSLVLMVENAGPLPVKAAGGIRDREMAIKMIELGVTRLGTSSAKTIVEGSGEVNNY